MKRHTRNLMAFLYLTVGYWIFTFLLLFALLPFTEAGPGFSTSSEQGVHQVRFHGSSGDLVLLLFVSDAGDKNLRYTTSAEPANAMSTSFRLVNSYFEFISIALFALISIPVLKRIFRNGPTTAEPTSPSRSGLL